MSARMSVTFRPGTLEDSYAVFCVFQESILDLAQRLNVMAITGGRDPHVLENLWQRRRPLFEHLARTAEHFWLAEAEGKVVGYARSILRGDVRELTEYFVLPGQQSAGLGRELLARAFPYDGAERRAIIATLDVRAQARYLKAGVYPRFPLYNFSRRPEPAALETDLRSVRLSATDEALAALRAVDLAVLGHARDVDHAWLLGDRQGFLFVRAGQPVGYGYVGDMSGPFALLSADDFPAALAVAEREAAARQLPLSLEVPTVNQVAVDYLLARGYQIDSFFAVLMSDAPLGTRFENYIFTSPPFFM